MAPEITKLVDEIKDASRKEKVKIVYDPEKADVFSLGILLASCCCLEMVDIKEPKEAYSTKLSLVQKQYPKLHSIVLDMLQPDPNLRKDFLRLYNQIIAYKPDLSKFPFFELEFESGLKATQTDSNAPRTFEVTYYEWIKKGDFNMRNNFFGEAIMSFLKVYEMIKRGEIPFKKE